MYQIPAQVLAIFCLPWAVQIVIMASRNVNLIHNKVTVYCQKIFITSELLISSNKNFCWDWCWVSHWTCCEEYHKNKDIHYHMAVNMTKPRRCQKWVKEQLKSKLNINVHFSDKSFGYFAAYRYIWKSDKEALHSENHPDLEILAPWEPKPAWKPTRQKTVLLRSLVNLSVHFHQKERKYLLQRSRPNVILQMLQSTFLTTESGHTLVCKL